MTVSKAITEWLKGYDMCVVRVDTDQVGEGTDSLGIFKSPTRERTDFLESSYQITEWYQLLVVREGQENRDREDNDEWLENLRTGWTIASTRRNCPSWITTVLVKTSNWLARRICLKQKKITQCCTR